MPLESQAAKDRYDSMYQNIFYKQFYKNIIRNRLEPEDTSSRNKRYRFITLTARGM